MTASATALIEGLQRSLAGQGVDYEAEIASFGQVDASEQRAKGRVFDLSEHIRAMILAQLSNQRPWKPIADNRDRLRMLFHDYDAEQLLAADPEALVAGLRHLRCGNRADRKQMAALSTNIRTLKRIEAEEGSLDAFVTRHAPDNVARLISQAGPFKLLHVGPALALEYLKTVGIRASKPDLHVRRALSGERLAYSTNHPSDWEAYRLIASLAAEAGRNPTYLDNLLWLFCAQDYGEICGTVPKCTACALASHCRYPSSDAAT